MRIWLSVRWSSEPEAYVSELGYVELATAPLNAGGAHAHITNLAGAGGSPGQRQWGLETYRRYLLATSGSDVWVEKLQPHIQAPQPSPFQHYRRREKALQQC